jgi:hypothetical protein
LGCQSAGFTALVDPKRSSEAPIILNIGTVARPATPDEGELKG